ncbi:oxidoreductase [Cellulomonas hominis]|uniref:D-threo-aldose 1-dehydrogenase n=1 Tax=Cellulomonas hominis TaxID=156981 RepID=A0A511FJ70_9CELL|nr:aldo/keto reductase [Cellulomonas hominis]MBB5471365.1 D-threo-aldose 1-dehydrogenase [Cellulomonas hominis]NKY06196.1 aldo/keto reductase [Cellulomonas hominis]GEL48417.1 oxidoreductase [Cellulomonas hominis]
MRTRSVAGDLALTEIGLGAAQFGNLNRETTDEASTAAVDRAWEAGIRYFDTAPHYGLGLSERRLGAALAGRPRDEFVLSTKVGRLLVPDPHGAGRTDDEGFVVPATTRRRWDFSRDGVLRSVEESLVRLGLDRIDVAYLHDPDDHWDAASTTGVGALIELRDQGVVRAVGAGMNQSAMLTELVRRCDVDVVMLAGRLTVLDQTALADLVPVAAERGVGIVAAGVYNSGILASPTVPDDAHFDYAQAPAELLARARAIAAVAGEFGVAVPELAVQYALAFDVVASVVLGTRTAAHVDAAVERYRATVPAELWTALVAQGLLLRVPGEH